MSDENERHVTSMDEIYPLLEESRRTGDTEILDRVRDTLYHKHQSEETSFNDIDFFLADELASIEKEYGIADSRTAEMVESYGK